MRFHQDNLKLTKIRISLFCCLLVNTYLFTTTRSLKRPHQVSNVSRHGLPDATDHGVQTQRILRPVPAHCVEQASGLFEHARVHPNNTAQCKTSDSWDASTDVCLFYTAELGIVEITKSRWRQAQAVESSVWHGSSDGQDRNEQHAAWFDGYKHVKPYAPRLGRMLEIGSGPFTQTKTVLEKLGTSTVNISMITLADPLMIFYHNNVPSCSYSSGSLLGFPTNFIAAGGEDLFLRSEYDTVIMVNVLEHCRDALSVLENLHRSVKMGGILIFSERWYDIKWDGYTLTQRAFWDVMHPINVKRSVIETLLSNYETVFRRNFFYEGDYPTDEGVYFIGVKKAPRPKME